MQFFFLKGPIDSKSAWVQVMAWRQTGDKPLPEPMMTQLTDAYMGHLASIVSLLQAIPSFSATPEIDTATLETPS